MDMLKLSERIRGHMRDYIHFEFDEAPYFDNLVFDDLLFRAGEGYKIIEPADHFAAWDALRIIIAYFEFYGEHLSGYSITINNNMIIEVWSSEPDAETLILPNEPEFTARLPKEIRNELTNVGFTVSESEYRVEYSIFDGQTYCDETFMVAIEF